MTTANLIVSVILIIGSIIGLKHLLELFFGIRICIGPHQWGIQEVMRSPGKRNTHYKCDHCFKNKVVESIDPYDHH